MLLFILFPLKCMVKRMPIQIHLMLLFILNEAQNKYNAALFKYISCYSLSAREGSISALITNSNTSHVTLYQIQFDRGTELLLIQIHLMLLFIVSDLLHRCSDQHSNTSHVTLYHSVQLLRCVVCLIQIHLMLVFILDRVQDSLDFCAFKYISCYSLSSRRILRKSCGTVFKYISCYSLSGSVHELPDRKDIQIHLMLLFIIIQNGNFRVNDHSNTSHVTLYL